MTTNSCAALALGRRLKTAFSGLLWLALVPLAAWAADKHENILVVRVTADSKPVAGAEVSAFLLDDIHAALTDQDGLARVSLPPGGKIDRLVALHSTLGVGGHPFDSANQPPTSGGPFELALTPSQPHTLSVVDTEGRPVPDLMCVVVQCSTSSRKSFPTRHLEKARFRTGPDGKAVVAWIPRDSRRVVVRPLDDRWKMEDCKTHKGVSTIKVRRLVPVVGRLRMPKGVPAEGLTISANGIGRSGWQHEVTDTVRRDGSFTVPLAPGDAYSVQLTDSKWASDAWTGIVPPQTSPPTIELVAYPATPLSIRVTQGPKHEPLADAWISLRSVHEVLGKDVRGDSIGLRPGIHWSLSTDSAGTARVAVGRGEYALTVGRDEWHEERTLTVKSGQPLVVAIGRGTLTGRLLFQGKPHAAAPGTIVRAWCTTQRQTAADGIVLPDGRFRVAIDSAEVSLFVLDAKSRLCAFGQIGAADATADLELVPTASYGGTVVDASGKPRVDHAVQLVLADAGFQALQLVLQSARCDERGRFQFDVVPAQVSLFVLSGTPASARGAAFSERSRDFAEDTELRIVLKPGEARTNVRVKPPREPVEAHLKHRLRDVRLAGMRLLVILRGDDSKGVADFTQLVFGSEDPPEILRYIPLYFEADEIQAAPGFFSALGWERPKSGEVVLVAVDATGATLGSRRIAVAGNGAAEAQAAQFVKRHALPALDAQALLQATQRDARNTGRRLVFVEGGPRCDPCRQMTRWMDEQHALLSKDYVILKLLGTETHASDVIGHFRSRPGGSIPWFAIAEPDGKVLATSDGPRGNTGFPSSFEDKKYFRRILDRTARHLTPAERERLIESLPND